MLFNSNKTVDYSLQIRTVRLANRSEGTTRVDEYRNELPLNLLYKRLVTAYRWSAGRSRKGGVISRRGGRLIRKSRKYVTNYHLRDERLSLIAGFIYSPARTKLFSLLFLSSGSVTYVPTAENHELFRLLKFNGVFRKYDGKIVDMVNRILPIIQVFFLIFQLPKNTAVSLLEIRPGRGVQYARSAGTKAVLVKMDSRVSTSLVKLPSGVRKIFSTYGLGSNGPVALPGRRKMQNNKASSMYGRGRKSVVRGVAMNPVDHPHGGRNKAIANQRTPWGKPTKRK